jgi:hypothetical protein
MSANVCIVTADQAFSAVALADVSELQLPIKSAGQYNFDFTVFFKSAVNTTGIFLSVNGPAVTWLRWGKVVPTSAAAVRSEVSTAWNGGSAESSSAGATELMALLKGSFVATASGILVARAATEVANSAITILRGSYGVLRP